MGKQAKMKRLKAASTGGWEQENFFVGENNQLDQWPIVKK